uniref:CTCK domain-containing protein n=1 Tax=Hucho hucho TaxID=62062 RepID=A0A4W5NGL0_9TELE
MVAAMSVSVFLTPSFLIDICKSSLKLIHLKISLLCAGNLITKPCNVTKGKVYLDSNGCKSANKVEVTTCGGSCETYAMYSLEANMMERSCTCCREVSTTKMEVEMICPDGSKFNHSYIHINKCGCQRTECVTPEATQVTRSRHRRR